jgi:hypothetical protein
MPPTLASYKKDLYLLFEPSEVIVELAVLRQEYSPIDTDIIALFSVVQHYHLDRSCVIPSDNGSSYSFRPSLIIESSTWETLHDLFHGSMGKFWYATLMLQQEAA